MGLVNGYDSESESGSEPDNDSGKVITTAKTSLSSLLPAPISKSAEKSSQIASSSSGLKLPPPASTNVSSRLNSENNAANHRRKSEKRQIRIDALESILPEEDAPSKRTKVDTEVRSSLTGLMGLLPAPKERPPPVSDSKSSQDATSNKMGISSSSTGVPLLQSDEKDSKKVKGNDDFRAMLGLKPSGAVPKAKPKVEIVSKPVANTSIAKPEQASLPKEEHFFTLPSADDKRSSRSTKAIVSISSAPIIEDEAQETPAEVPGAEDKYAGWQQGPDGNWFPVTPEAHAAYSQYLASLGQSDQELRDRPANMQFNEADLSHSVDANASRQAWLSRPSTEIDTSSSGLDRKYAMAAASLATPDQGIPLVDQEEEIKKMDKKTNFRARRKGQLSALIAQAEENREKLEEKWSRGKDGRHAAKEKYGF